MRGRGEEKRRRRAGGAICNRRRLPPMGDVGGAGGGAGVGGGLYFSGREACVEWFQVGRELKGGAEEEREARTVRQICPAIV